MFSCSVPVNAVEEKQILTDLLYLFAQEKESTVDFSEEKHAFFLDKPIKSSGYIEFFAPNTLNKFIQKPEKITQKLTGKSLEIINATQIHTVDLNEHPEFSTLLQSIMSLLTGDIASLKKDFKIAFTGTLSNWSLSLTPHESYILAYIESIKFSGEKNKLSKIIVIEPNSDKSITLLSNHR